MVSLKVPIDFFKRANESLVHSKSHNIIMVILNGSFFHKKKTFIIIQVINSKSWTVAKCGPNDENISVKCV